MQSLWEVRLSSSRGMPYFFNTQTQQSVWEPPSELSPDQVNALPGAKEYLIGEDGRPAQVRASHLLVKHRGSRRPSSWKEVRYYPRPVHARMFKCVYALRCRQTSLGARKRPLLSCNSIRPRSTAPLRSSRSSRRSTLIAPRTHMAVTLDSSSPCVFVGFLR